LQILLEISSQIEKAECNFNEGKIYIPDYGVPGVTLALIIHEICHFLFTTYDLGQIVTPKETKRFHILNTLEDVRINRRCFDLLPGIKPVFEEFYTYLSLQPFRLKSHQGIDRLQRGLEGFSKEPSKELVFLSELAIGYLDLLANTAESKKGIAYIKNVRSLIDQIEKSLK